MNSLKEKNYVLVINCGSSSIKLAIVEEATGEMHFSALAEALYLEEASLTHEFSGKKSKMGLNPKDGNADHTFALNTLVEHIVSSHPDILENLVAVSHRVVHGGETFKEPTLVNDDTVAKIEACSRLAPLHNPANILGIKAAQKAFPNLPHFVVFDTAYHQTLPEVAYRYAIPKELYEKDKIRRYGFHGSSHHFCAEKIAGILKKDKNKINAISCHLGNGASVCAIKDGKSVDTSMGMTPLEGLVMGTRSGDLDPYIPLYLQQSKGMSADEVDNLLNKKSGLLGISGISSDCRTLEDNAIKDGEKNSVLSLDLFAYRLAKYIASYFAALPSVDCIFFTGGIGENSPYLRDKTIKNLASLGLSLDDAKNEAAFKGKEGKISKDDSNIPVYVIKTNEEWQLAKEAVSLLKKA